MSKLQPSIPSAAAVSGINGIQGPAIHRPGKHNLINAFHGSALQYEYIIADLSLKSKQNSRVLRFSLLVPVILCFQNTQSADFYTSSARAWGYVYQMSTKSSPEPLGFRALFALGMPGVSTRCLPTPLFAALLCHLELHVGGIPPFSWLARGVIRPWASKFRRRKSK